MYTGNCHDINIAVKKLVQKRAQQHDPLQMFNPHHRFFSVPQFKVSIRYTIYIIRSRKFIFFRSAPFIRREDIVNEGVPIEIRSIRSP